MQEDKNEFMAADVSKWVTFVFTGAIAYQIFHWIEHLAQIYQHWWLGISIQEAHGILFFFDLEWNHFVFNSFYLAGLLAVFFGGGFHRKLSPYRKKPLIFTQFLIGGVLLQSYHQIEHFFRIYQHLLTFCEPCPGILGFYIDGIYLHFIFNTLVLAAPLAAYISHGFLRKALESV